MPAVVVHSIILGATIATITTTTNLMILTGCHRSDRAGRIVDIDVDHIRAHRRHWRSASSSNAIVADALVRTDDTTGDVGD